MLRRADPRRELVRRVAQSAELRRSPRQRELLTLLCEQALADPSRELQTSAVAALFARPALGAALEADNLVRVHVTRLRQRLARYFAGAGAAEPIVIEIPAPGCTPVFRDRRPPRRGGRSFATVAAGVALVLLVASASLALRRGEPPPPPSAPPVDRLWAQMLGGRDRLWLVLGTVAEGPGGGPWTSLADARVAQRVGALGAAHGVAVEIVPAAEAGADVCRHGNAVLTGPPRANPWLAVFERRLIFRAVDAARGTAFENVRPRAGEAARYAPSEGRGYCRVAWIPSMDATGSILLISGTEMASTEAGLDLLTRGEWVQRLRARLGLAAGDPYPHFEALLATELLGSSSVRFELAAARSRQGAEE